MSDFGKDKTVWNKTKKKARQAIELILADGRMKAQGEVNSWK